MKSYHSPTPPKATSSAFLSILYRASHSGQDVAQSVPDCPYIRAESPGPACYAAAAAFVPIESDNSAHTKNL
ncbi:hypothetical protein SKAU_G00049760 [Synaphobranchus kaupii]|uniref:Uncharacterized protein n=1 Tax=Synaphobranchus kaupii TaxID=118154 RepID=A0A9Q1G372_SYNKA|nr:hypothetical protein SKAU_G00049760 [Synaphobranchus kaupii]